MLQSLNSIQENDFSLFALKPTRISQYKSIGEDEFKPVIIKTKRYQKDYTVEYGVGTNNRAINKEILSWILDHPAYYRLNLVMPKDSSYEDLEPLLSSPTPYEQLQDLMKQKGYEFNITYVNVAPFKLYNKIFKRYEDFIGIQYWFAYIFNYKILDNHEFDWEHITIVLDNSSLEPLWVILSQHWWREYRYWYEMERIGSHPVIYVANGGHANYRNPGVTKIRDIIDHHDGNGATIKPDIRLILNPLWIRFPGYWIDGICIDSICIKAGWLHWKDIIYEDILPVKGETSEIVGGPLQDFIENNYMINETLELDEHLDTFITIKAPSVASEGQEITISGRLISEDGKPISYALIKIYDDDTLLEPDQDFIACGFTNESGYYNITWKVNKSVLEDPEDSEDNTLELYAVFDKMYVFNSGRSPIVNLCISTLA